MKRGCLYCYNENVDRAMEVFRGFYPNIRLIYPQKTRRRLHKAEGTYTDEIIPLLPGYLFFETEEDLPEEKLAQTDYMLRLLTYTDGEWLLRGADDVFARKMFEADGRIRLSRAYYDDNRRIRIVEGFLKPYEDAITRVNRRNNTAEIGICFQERQIHLWLGFELDRLAS